MKKVVIGLGCVIVMLFSCSKPIDPKQAFDKGNYKKAFPIWQSRGEQGDLDAQNFLGTHYLFGLGVKQDFSLARQWYTKAAQRGHADAQRNLGSMYESGVGMPRDFEQAFIWFYAAHRQGHKNANAPLQAITSTKLTPNNQLLLKEKAREYILKDVLNVSDNDS